MDQQRLRELLDYDAETGVFTWRVSQGRGYAGAVAGTVRQDGYIAIKLDGRLYKAHRLAWLHEHGEFPDDEIDHINGDRSDNRPGNLRVVTRLINAQNRRRSQSNNRAGILGVSRHRNRWQAQIEVAGKNKHLGCFNTQEAAHAAYVAAKRQTHEGCTL